MNHTPDTFTSCQSDNFRWINLTWLTFRKKVVSASSDRTVAVWNLEGSGLGTTARDWERWAFNDEFSKKKFLVVALMLVLEFQFDSMTCSVPAHP